MKKKGIGANRLSRCNDRSSHNGFCSEINPPMTNVIGSYGSILAALIAAKIFKVSDGLYYAGLAFVFCFADGISYGFV